MKLHVQSKFVLKNIMHQLFRRDISCIEKSDQKHSWQVSIKMNGHLVCLVIAVCQMIFPGDSEAKPGPGPQPGLFSCDTLAAMVKPWCMVKDAIQLSSHPHK